MSPSADTPSTSTDPAVAASSWNSELPRRVRTRPRAYGTGRYGVDRYDSRNDTQYSWTRIVQPVAVALAFFIGLVVPARAANPFCEGADAATTQYQFCKPAIDVEGANPWGSKWNSNADMIESALQALSVSTGQIGSLSASTAALSVSTAALNAAKVNRAGDTMTGQLTLSGSTLTVGGTAFSVGATTLVVTGGNVGVGASTPAAKFHLSSGTLLVDGAGGVISVPGSSVTANAFFGDGSHLTGVGVGSEGNTFTSSKTFTSDVSVGGNLGVGRTNAAQKLHLSSGTLLVDGSGGNISVPGSSITASAFFGDGSNITGLTPCKFSSAGGISCSTIGAGFNNVATSRSVLIGGAGNTVSATDAVAIGATNSTISGSQSIILGADTAVVSATNSVVSAGSGHSATGTNGFIGGGVGHSIAGARNAILGGSANTISGASTNDSIILGGGLNIVSASNAVAAGRNVTVSSASAWALKDGDGSNSPLINNVERSIVTSFDLGYKFYTNNQSRIVSIGTDGQITAPSSVTASGFFGDGSALTNTVLSMSSSTTSSVAINSLTYVTVSTLTVTGMRGSRYARIHVIAQITNASAAAREYTMKIQKDGVDVGNPYSITAQNTINGNATQNIAVTETSTSGTHVYTALILSSSTGATQTTTTRELTVQEY